MEEEQRQTQEVFHHTVVGELKAWNHTCSAIANLTQNRLERRTFGDALDVIRHNGSN